MMIKKIDDFLNNITMYRLVLYYLGGLIIIAVILSLIGTLHFSPLVILGSTAILLLASWTSNKFFGSVYKAPINHESAIITALILALIINPNLSFSGIIYLLVVSIIAMGSKYIITINQKHIFNPAAIALVVTDFGPHQGAGWWIGTSVMLPFVVIGGLLVVRKVRRGLMVGIFLIASAISTATLAYINHVGVGISIENMILSSGVLFLGFVMLTEPLTSPITAKMENLYAVIVGALLPPQVHFLGLYSTPELSLAIGNIFSYMVSPKIKIFPKLIKKNKIANNTVDFIFRPDRSFDYLPGQYMEWTLPHDHIDSRGNRRYFTLASSPTESEIIIGVKFYDKGSSYKNAMIDMTSQSKIVATQIEGDFVLPDDKSKKLVFIAGGIGITPFRSMIKYLIDKEEKRSIKLLYSVHSQDDIAYGSIFEQAKKNIDLETVYFLTDKVPRQAKKNMQQGFITGDKIKELIPDFMDRYYYISGTHEMVVSLEEQLKNIGIHHDRILVDFFPGYNDKEDVAS